MANYASSVSTDPKVEAPGDAALLHLLDGYYIKRHTVNPWNTSGGYCDVFTGDHPRFGKVALKRPRGNQCDESNLRNFRREARIWKELQHPHILQFVGMIDTSSHVWLVSVFAENGKLHEYISTHKEADRHSLVLQFTSGLAYLHSKDVVHGDLKADNLLISASHYLLIADFGLSKIKGMSTYTSKKGVGSVRWMAPELLEGDEEEEAIKTLSSDVYAYGITLSEILRGELPFKQYTNMITLVKAILKNKRPPIPDEPPQEAAILWAAAKDCWNAKPSKRPTMVDICCRFSLDCTKQAEGAAPSDATRANEVSHGSGLTKPAPARPETAALNESIDFNPQSVNPTIRSNDLSDHRLLQLLGNTEHGDIGHMLDDGLCLRGTRVEILDRLDAWAADPQSPQIMLLKGQAGRGKSTIARSTSSRYRKRWGTNASSAVFHFRRGNEGLNTRPLLALARQLACSAHPGVRKAILKSIQDQEDVAQLRFEEQFEVLFVQPLQELGPNTPPILLVIDALDECSDHSLISALLRLIRKYAPSLPSTIKFLLTTRPEERIVGPFRTFSNSDHEDLDTVDLAIIDRDVRSYFTTRLSDIQQEYGFGADWLPPRAINELVSLSQGLFQWAHAAMEYVRERPRPNLRRLIGSPTNVLGLPALYKQILSTAFPLRKDIQDGNNFLALIKHVIGSLVVAHRPMSPAVLEYLWDNIPGFPPVSHPAIEIRDGILGRLGSILMLPATPDGSIHFLHASVRDFFTDSAQCEDKRFLIDVSVHHTRLAFKCFNRMKRNLKLRIHRINGADLSKTEAEVTDLVEQCLPPGLQYCCRSWSTHVSETSYNGDGYFDMQQQIREFCTERLPYWIECLSVTGALSEAFDMIRRATGWLEDAKGSESQVGSPATILLSDTNDFCRQFFKHMSTYPRHVTLSYLLHFQSETILRKVYADSIGQQAPRIVRGPPLKRFDWSKVLRGGSAVCCVAFSPDGKTLACGLHDNTIRLWNMDTGEPTEVPLDGHKSRVNSLAFSPDSKTLASGSDDTTVRLWNMDTGEPRELAGHYNRVTSVAYSPDGKSVASGSYDSTIRLWKVDNEESSVTLLFGHKLYVSGVAFSPDGKSLASGSYDTTVRLWALDLDIEEPMGTPLVHHNHWITCVAFSPDGETLAFGSFDNTVWLRSMGNGERMTLQLVGHKSRVNGLAFSTDSKTLASGSDDGTIRLWNVDTGKPKGTPRVGHKDRVSSVTYSPDGRTLASGSYDSTVRLWTVDTGSGEPTESPLVGYNKRIRNVAYSVDDKILASGSADGQIRLWDIETGEQNGTPLTGHNAPLTTLAFFFNSTILVSAADDHQIRLWDMRTRRQKGATFVGHTARVTSIAFSSDTKILASGSEDDQIWLWNINTGKRVGRPLAPHKARVTSIAVSSRSEILASRSDDHHIRVWNIDIGAPMLMFPVDHKNHVRSVGCSPEFLTVRLDNGTSWTWAVATGERRKTLWPSADDGTQVTCVAYSLGGKTVAVGSADSRIRLWGTGTHKQKGKSLVGRKAQFTSIALSSDCQIIASRSDDHEIRLWDINTGRFQAVPVISHQSKDCVHSLAFSPNGNILAAGSDIGTIRLWNISDAASRVERLGGQKAAGRRAKVPASEKKARLWNVTLQDRLIISATLRITSLAFSPDGEILASGLDDGTIHFWNINTGEPQSAPLAGLQSHISSLAFTPDGKKLASGLVNGTVQLWVVATGQPEKLLLSGHQSDVSGITFALDGKTLVSHSNLESSYETICWSLGCGATSMDRTCVDDEDSKGLDASMQGPNAKLRERSVDLDDRTPHDVSVVRLDVDSSEAYERGWVFVRGKRCFWLPPEFYECQGDPEVNVSLFGEHFLVIHHPSIRILDISAFL